MSKNKKATEPTVLKTEEVQIEKDLQAKIQSIKDLATIHSLLQKCYLPAGHDFLVDRSLKFVQVLHKTIMDDAKTHAQFNLVPELVAATQAVEGTQNV